jgi:hypothetical protein
MSHRGRRPSWTEEQRRRALELAASGESQREIAKSVFGDARYRGRVERILKAEDTASFASQEPPQAETTVAEDDTPPMSDLEVFRELVERAERELLTSASAPSLADIQRLLRVKREVRTLESIELSKRPARGLG